MLKVPLQGDLIIDSTVAIPGHILSPCSRSGHFRSGWQDRLMWCKGGWRG